MAELLQELITQILQLLPVKTLLRFRCICKTFRAIIDSRYFINSHVNTTFENRTHRKLIFREKRRTHAFSRISVLDIDNGFKQVLDIDDGFPRVLDIHGVSSLEFLFDIPRHKRSYNCFLAHCNGLVLLGRRIFNSRGGPRIIGFLNLDVWNPSTRQYRKLRGYPSQHIMVDHEDISMLLGLGYDSCTDDYKVLLLIENHSDGGFEAWIFGLRLGFWRRIRTTSYDKDWSIIQDAVDCFVDGALYFLCKDGKIFAFDVAKETFSTLSQPIHRTGWSRCGLQVFDGCLWFSCAENEEEVVFFYVRKKDGVEFSWTRLFSIYFTGVYADMMKYGVNLLRYSKEEEKILLLCGNRMLSYDLTEKSLHEIEFRDKTYEMLDSIPFIESLVPVDYPESKKKKSLLRIKY